MKVLLAFLAGVVTATLIWQPWNSDLGVAETGLPNSPTAASPREPASEPRERASEPHTGERSALIPVDSTSEPPLDAPKEVTEKPPTRRSSEFYRNLAGAERERFFAEHRWDYIKTHRDAVQRAVASLETLEGARERFHRADSLSKTSIALLLDLHGRAVAWEPGVKMHMDTGKDGWYSFLSSNWIYRVNKSEFPEIAYFMGRQPHEIDPDTGEKTYLPMDPAMLAMALQRAQVALDLYDLSVPKEGE